MSSISYGDPPARTDRLGLENYVEAFKRVVLNKDTATPLTIAVLGEWGKGKTSFMHFLRERLEQHRPVEPTQTGRGDAKSGQAVVTRAVTVWFDAWQYDSEEKVLAALLQTTAKEVEAHFTPYSWLKYRLILGIDRMFTSWRAGYRLFVHALVIPGVLVLASVAVLGLGPQLARSGWDLQKAVLALLGGIAEDPIQGLASGGVGLLVAMLYLCWGALRRLSLPLGLDVSKLYEERDHSERLGFLTVFKEEFQRRIDQMAVMPTWSLRTLPEFAGEAGPGGGSLRDLGNDVKALLTSPATIFRRNVDPALRNRVVIFIDDLDRCRPDKIIDILEAIKVTMDTRGIVFVLGMDDSYIKSAIYQRYQNHIEIHGRLYPAGPAGGVEGMGIEAGVADESGTAESTRDGERLGAEWPARYLEKVIQIPFHLPDAAVGNLETLLGGLLETGTRAAGKEGEPPAPPSPEGKRAQRRRESEQRMFREQILARIDAPEVGQLILDAALEVGRDCRGNPRRVKDFVNRCRLGLYLLQLDSADLIQQDYQEAMRHFGDWERGRLGRGTSGPDPLADRHDQWHRRLREIRHCLFEPSAAEWSP